MTTAKQSQAAVAAPRTKVLELHVRRGTAGAYVNNMVGTATAHDERNQVTVGSPMALGYVANSQGIYRAIAPFAVFKVGQSYRCDVVGDVPGGRRYSGTLTAVAIQGDT